MSEDRKVTIAEHVREVRTKKPVNNVITGDVVGGDVVTEEEEEEEHTDAERGREEPSEGDS